MTQANTPLSSPYAHSETINYQEQPGRACGILLLTLQKFRSFHQTGSTKMNTYFCYHQSFCLQFHLQMSEFGVINDNKMLQWITRLPVLSFTYKYRILNNKMLTKSHKHSVSLTNDWIWNNEMIIKWNRKEWKEFSKPKIQFLLTLLNIGSF